MPSKVIVFPKHRQKALRATQRHIDAAQMWLNSLDEQAKHKYFTDDLDLVLNVIWQHHFFDLVAEGRLEIDNSTLNRLDAFSGQVARYLTHRLHMQALLDNLENRAATSDQDQRMLDKLKALIQPYLDQDSLG